MSTKKTTMITIDLWECHDLKEDLMGTKFLLYLYIC